MFREAQEKLKKTRGDKWASPVLGFHGTNEANIVPICENGFKVPGVLMLLGFFVCLFVSFFYLFNPLLHFLVSKIGQGTTIWLWCCCSVLRHPLQCGRLRTAPHLLGSSHATDFKMGVLVATLSDSWCYRVSARTGLADPVSADWKWVWLRIRPATSISVQQHVKLSSWICLWCTLCMLLGG